MKMLYLVRHAKSSWEDISLRDFDRPLNTRGKEDAPLMGRIMRQMGVLPDLVVASPAKRAWSTAKKMAAEMHYPKDAIATTDEIYHAPADILFELLTRLPADKQSVMLIGHNPGLTELASRLSHNDFENIPTCGIVCVSFPVECWKEINERNGQFLFFEFPKKHK